MSTSVDISFVRQYERDVHHIFQREGGMLRPSVRMKTGVVGKSTTFQKIGKGIATTKSRHGVVTPMNQSHTAIECNLVDFYAGDWVDKLDEAKLIHDERLAIAQGGAWALGRKVDDQIITVLDSTTEPAVTLPVSSSLAIQGGLLELVEALNANDVPNDSRRYGLLTPRMWSQAMTVESFASADFVGPNGLPFTTGVPMFRMWKSWMGLLWTQHTGLPNIGTASAQNFVWHASAVGYATGAHAGNVADSEAVTADITWHGDHVAHFINHMMSGGGCMIDTTGVIQGDSDDTASVATT